MTAKVKKAALAAARSAMPGPRTLPGQLPPSSLEECLEHIEAMGKRVNGFVEFMCQVESLTCMSAEAKERAVHAFYHKLVVLERELRTIHDGFKLE